MLIIEINQKKDIGIIKSKHKYGRKKAEEEKRKDIRLIKIGPKKN